MLNKNHLSEESLKKYFNNDFNMINFLNEMIFWLEIYEKIL